MDCEDNNDPRFHTTITTEIVDHFESPVGEIICNPGLVYPQACQNYRSIVNHYPEYVTLTCPYRKPIKTLRPVSSLYATKQRDRKKYEPASIVDYPVGGCSPDEYPPAAMCDVNDGFDDLKSVELARPRAGFVDRGQRIRLIASKDNGDAGRIFNKCPEFADRKEENKALEYGGRKKAKTTTRVRAVFDRQRYTLRFVGVPNLPDDGLMDNQCAPTFNGAKHPGYCLLNSDQWFDLPANAAEAALRDSYKPPGKRSRRRGAASWAGKELVYVEANSTRKATPEELRREFGFERCEDETCSRELEALKAVMETVSKSEPLEAEAVATEVAVVDALRETEMPPTLPGSNVLGADLPKRTEGAEPRLMGRA
jgi:chitinase